MTKKKAAMKGWVVTNASRLGRGSDPTWITSFELTKVSPGVQWVSVEEFQNIFTVGIDERRINGLTCREANSFLTWVGAPTFEEMWTELEGLTEEELKTLAEGHPDDAIYGEA